MVVVKPENLKDQPVKNDIQEGTYHPMLQRCSSVVQAVVLDRFRHFLSVNACLSKHIVCSWKNTITLVSGENGLISF